MSKYIGINDGRSLIRNEWGHPLSTYAKLSKKLTFLRTCAYQGVRNVGFSENFAYIVNG